MIWYILSYSPFSGDGQKHPGWIMKMSKDEAKLIAKKGIENRKELQLPGRKKGSSNKGSIQK
ncbi:hypothetical protein [Bacillus paranthracis]|uniref:hypothetical protein n=1 Tax=Bacillus paranthracis TaxID=2026186 RepID=UPI0021D29957|nr:hypothetical protein [Bacillus paranthracis]MCU5209283.1 hypothetical protein [Bacillus paranthracis]